MGPTLSRLQLKVMPPALLTRPNVGRKPVAPQVDDGEMMEPQVSVPIAKGTRPATVAEAEPAEEPDEPKRRFQGLLVRPPYQRSPMAKAPKVNLATSTAPASRSLLYTVASSSMI